MEPVHFHAQNGHNGMMLPVLDFWFVRTLAI
jgi:hypothetical protein